MTEPVHSPLGASSAERWMACPGSINLCKTIAPREDAADPEYRKEGTAAHAAIAYCLTGTPKDAWEAVGETMEGVVITSDIADAIQVFLDEVNPLAAGADCTYVETHLKGEHPQEYGTIDFGAVKDGTLYVRDYKHGQGIVVETENNQQMMYYAHLLLLKHPDVRRVNIRIVQPRIPYAVCEPWEVPPEVIMDWADHVLLPAMRRTETDNTLVPGEHCRFCEAKETLVCPVIKDHFLALTVTDAKTTNTLSDTDLLNLYGLIAQAKMVIKALGDEAMRRMMANGLPDNGVIKLVNQKANRVWKSEAAAVLIARFGDKVWNAPEFKSPAEMEKVDPIAKKMAHEYAYTPQTGYTIVSVDDKRPAVKIQSATEQLAKALDTPLDM